jgi:uncharacterized membrane protein YjjP (DUF1212 family)
LIQVAAERAHGALRVLRGTTPPAQLVAPRKRDTEADDLVAYDVIDLTLRMGEALISAGSPVAGVTATVLRVAAAYGLTSCQVDITFTSITLSVTRDNGEPVTSMRVVQFRAADYSRLAAIYRLADDAIAGLPLAEALERLDTIIHAPHPYQRWVVTLALAGLAAAVAGLLGGGPEVAVVAACVTAAIDRLQRWLNAWGLPLFFQQAAGAALATGVAVGLAYATPHLPVAASLFKPSLVVASGIVVLLAGLGLVGSVEDAISGHYLTAGARTFEVVLNTVGIVVGVAAVLDISHRGGLVPAVPGAVHLRVSLVGLIAIAAAISGCWALSSYAGPRAVLVAAAGGGVGYAIYAGCRDLGIGVTVASGVAALLVGAIADVAGDRFGVPALVVATSGVVPLLPGLGIYRALFALVNGTPQQGITLLLGAVTIGLGLASGVALGAFIARPLRAEADRWERRVRRMARSSRD